jgi:hypothetical protein
MSTATLNGKPQRKQLSDQLDRLDSIIDCLADALPEAVRDAVHDGTKAALHQLIVETLTNPDTLAMIRQAMNTSLSPTPVVPLPVPVPKSPSLWSRGKSWVSEKLCHLREKLRSVRTKCQPLITPVREKLAEVKTVFSTAKGRVGRWLQHINILWQFKRMVAISVTVGAVVLTVSLLSHSTATVFASLGTTVSLLCVQLGLWCRKTVQRIVG